MKTNMQDYSEIILKNNENIEYNMKLIDEMKNFEKEMEKLGLKPKSQYGLKSPYDTYSSFWQGRNR